MTQRNTYLGKKCKFLLLKPQQTNKRCFVMQQHLDSSSSVDISFSLAICILIVHLRVSIIIFCRVHFEWWWPSFLYHFFVFRFDRPLFLREIKDLVRALHVMPQDFGSFSDISYDLRKRVENKLVCKKLSDRKGQKNHCYVVFFCQVRSNLVILAHNFIITRTRRHNLW